MEKTYNYFYKIENKINGHYYYGIHSTDDLYDGYMGSGKRLHVAYRTYGIENFEKTILKFFDTRKEASVYEAMVVTESLTENNDCYNIVVGGENLNTLGKSVVIDNEDGKCKLIGCEEYHQNKDRYRAVTKGLILAKRYGDDKFEWISKVEYENNKDKYTCPMSGTVFVKDKNNNYYRVSVTDSRYLSGEVNCVWKGRNHTEETKKKMSDVHKANGLQIGNKNSQYGKCWITRNGVNKSIHKSELQEYLIDGWVIGRTLRLQNDKISSIDKDRVMKLREEGKTWASIAKELNISENGIYKYKKRNNL